MTAEDLARTALSALHASVSQRCYILSGRRFSSRRWCWREVDFREGHEIQAIAALIKDVRKKRFNRFGVFPESAYTAGTEVAVASGKGIAVRAVYQYSLTHGKLGRLDVLGSRKDANQ